MKRAFNLIELIFVVVIIGILVSIGFYSFKPKNLQNDANYALMKILKSRYQALNFDKREGEESSQVGCIDLSTIKDDAYKNHYDFKSEIVSAKDICFDHMGEAFVSNQRVTTITEILRLRYRNKEAGILVFSKTGYVIIKYN